MAKRPRYDEDYEDDDRDDLEVSDGGAVSSIIPYKNPLALTAYYLGFASLLFPLGSIFGLPAIILGIVGFMKSRSNPNAKGTAHAIVGILLGLAGFFVCGPLGWVLIYVGFIAKPR